MNASPFSLDPEAVTSIETGEPVADVDLRSILAAGLAGSIAGCGGSDDAKGAATGSAAATTPTAADTPTSPTSPTSPTNPNGATPPGSSSSVVAPTSTEAARFLLQAQLDANDAAIAMVRSKGCSAWLDEQMAVAPGPAAWDQLNASGYGSLGRPRGAYFAYYPAEFVIWRQLFTATDGVRKRAALALSEFFVVSISGGDYLWCSHSLAHYWDRLNALAFDNFRTLLEAVTLHPAMGFYLNTKGNQKENPATGRLPDENYAREVMQLFTIGLHQLNPDGTPKRDGQGRAVETYAQSDVSQLARVFTGYDFDTSRGVDYSSDVWMNVGYTKLPMTLDPTKHPSRGTVSKHSALAASFLGKTVAAGTDGTIALKIALDTLFEHPNVGPFFGRQMIQRLVTSNPSSAYVGRVAAAFADNGRGVRGDLKAVWRAVLLDPEAQGSAGLSDPSWGKLREPMLRFVQWGRSFGIQSKAGTWKIGDMSAPTSLGQSPFRSPSVFNFFRPGYVPAGTALAAAGTPAPEFQIVNESTVAGYLNTMQRAIRDGLYVNAPDVLEQTSNTSNGYDIQCTYTAELALAHDAAALVARLNRLLCADQLSAFTVSAIVGVLETSAVAADATDARKLDRIATAVLMVMAAPEYLVQK